jgi:hypothetical protein
MLASFSTPSISSAIDSSGAAATFTHLSAMHASYPRLFTEAPPDSYLSTNSTSGSWPNVADNLSLVMRCVWDVDG